MWFSMVDGATGECIEGQEQDGSWRFRTRITRRTGPYGAYLEPTLATPSADLRTHMRAFGDAHPARLRPAIVALLEDAIDRLSWEDDGDIDLDPWRDIVQHVTANATAFTRAYFTLRDLLRLAADRIARRHAPQPTPESAFAEQPWLAEDDPELHALMNRIVRVVTSPWWGEAGTWRHFEAPMAQANHEAALFAWRRENIATLPLEDLDALIADRQCYLNDQQGPDQVEVDLSYLLPLRARIDSLAPWADLTRPPGADVTVAVLTASAREVTLVRNARRWGLAWRGDAPLGGADMLPPGLGAEIAQRVATAPSDAQRNALAEDVAALAHVICDGLDPREPLTVLVHGRRELQARWRRGTWQWRARHITWHGESWRRGKRRTSWRRGIAGLLPVDFTHHGLPTYLHPMVATWVSDAFAVAANARGPSWYEDQAWHELLTRARAGEIVRMEDDPYTPEWVFATDASAGDIELLGGTWPSIDEAVAAALQRPDTPVAWAHATLFAALRSKHTQDFIPTMVLRNSADTPLLVRSRWDALFGDNIVGRMLMRIRAGHTTPGKSDNGDDSDDEPEEEASADIDPDDPDALMERGLQLADQGELEAAEAHLRAAAEVSGGEPFFVSNFASFLANNARDEEALELYDLARTTLQARVEPDAEDDPELWLLGSVECHMALCLADLDRLDEARALATPWREHPDHGPEVASLFGPS